ncbi:indolepyruvate ferredoxin oxidoreductase [Variovorax sp. WS11]|uniref:indolepyruvate ferredoxin oxidoreductase family protein n=1 Tax=Variovorax sp. WS11 TaxID=1105204 RepID=UPI000D0DDD2E|nr:indolepyruvate ferredoxin oxidoreductase family protein [Variovorax sp. WS11]NDZ17350.1 indolepyruvate ferredoxin oxidoreductase family protein [Variovorax sp. WS11]PSL86110.1 indolepyruvate ferredoxin oxidoreductase [Variovorax sp. WS11]
MTEERPDAAHARDLRRQGLDARQDMGEKEVLVSGSQALLRVLLAQREIDRRAGLKTAGYVSGYRGSPLGGFDLALWKAQKALRAADIVFQPGVNEELAATAVSGSQQLEAYGPARVDGVFSLWYGKGPGVDRAVDALKHASYAGVHRHGGALAVFGDDHPGKSSSIVNHSEQAMASLSIPVLYPANVEDTLQFGLLGYAMSRYSGSWVGIKMVNETAEQTAIARLDLDALRVALPSADDLTPPEGVHYRGSYAPLRDEEIVNRHRLPLVYRFARANRLDTVTLGGAGRLGIVTAGKAHQDVRQALRILGIDAERARTLGVAVYKAGMIWPLEPLGLREFAAGREELFFVEEKAAFMELQAAALLYNAPARPAITGKHDLAGHVLLPSERSLEPAEVALAIATRLEALGMADEALAARVAGLRSYRRAIIEITPAAERRLPYFCSGCPHNASTALPEGSEAIAGIGCHGMAMWAKPRTHLSTQMGGEGLNWVGLAPFSKTRHVFQNLGDGTYFHSGILAIRAAVASGVNITYKILFNDAVAMTGGQPVDGQLDVAHLAQEILAEGVKRVVVLTEDVGRYAGRHALPGSVDLLDRRELQRVQKELRDQPGCTALIYDQTCAAEKRRRRKKGEYPDPDRRVYINPDVCEGCGDCSVQSGCVSVEPLETELGRKRTINQSACNKDFSCVQGFCPSFVTVHGARLADAGKVELPTDLLRSLPRPEVAPILGGTWSVMMAGIGGTGVVTVSAILGMAAYLEHKAPSSYDMTGLSQKNGAVFSHLRIAERPEDIHSQRLGQGDANLVLGFDMVAALSDESFRTFGDTTRFVGNRRIQETAAFVTDREARVDRDLLQRKVLQRLARPRTSFVDATGLALALFGDTIAANMFLLGVAAQRGWLPVGLEAIEQAMALNGVQVEMNRRAFEAGRLWVAHPQRVEQAALPRLPAQRSPDELSMDELIAHRTRLLTDYQDAGYASRWRTLLNASLSAELAIGASDHALSRAVAHNFAKLMAYKDEYEVARLYTRPDFMEKLRAQFDGQSRLGIHLAPPLFARRDPVTGQPRKAEWGPWVLHAMRVLARLKGLRGTRFDPFGRTEERRAERALIDQYEATVREMLVHLRKDNLAAAVALASLPDGIRGFGHVKAATMATVAAKRSTLLQAFHATASGARGALETEGVA